jgi:FixJ family two-component response regulator
MKAVIIDDDPPVRALLVNVFHRRGYEVVSYPEPKECPLYSEYCPCQMEKPCPIIIVSDYEMPNVNGVVFIEALRKKGCKCPNIALMSACSIPREMLERAAKLKIKFFAKPFHRSQINDWLNQIETQMGQPDKGIPHVAS